MKDNFLIGRDQQAKGHEFHYSTLKVRKGCHMRMKQKVDWVESKKVI